VISVDGGILTFETRGFKFGDCCVGHFPLFGNGFAWRCCANTAIAW
jgi:hypothetical protein